MTVKIYLRAIVRGNKDALALFDSNRNGEINDLETSAEPGSVIVWKPDCCSGIKQITAVYSAMDDHPVFKNKPVKRKICKGFKLQLTEDARGVEKYAIECTLADNKKLVIDPFIRVPPLTARD